MIINTVSNNFREKNDIELITSRIPVNYPSAIYIYALVWLGVGKVGSSSRNAIIWPSVKSHC